jgi:hypothetical protein
MQAPNGCVFAPTCSAWTPYHKPFAGFFALPDRHVKRKYVTAWKKQSDGTWKVTADIFNSDLPSAGGSAAK